MSIWSKKKWLISFQILPFIFLFLMLVNFLKINKEQENDKKYGLIANKIGVLIEQIPSTVSNTIHTDDGTSYQRLSRTENEITQHLDLLKTALEKQTLFTSFIRKSQKDSLEKFSEKWNGLRFILGTIGSNKNNSILASKMNEKLKIIFSEVDKNYLEIIKVMEGKNNNSTKTLEIIEQIIETKDISSKFEKSLDINIFDIFYNVMPYDNLEKYFKKCGEIRSSNQDDLLSKKFEEVDKNLGFIRENQENIIGLIKWVSHLREIEKSIYKEVLPLLNLSTEVSSSYYYLENGPLSDVSTYILAFLILVSVLFLLYFLYQNKLNKLIFRKDEEISKILSYINSLTSSLEEVYQHASESASIASESVVIANEGGKALRDTIHGMEDVQEEIQGTSNSILLLNKGSQEIEDIVSLIDAIADQTNILSLNASIQAAMAGEAGRGFGVVADEVQRLAIKASYATRQIASLVKNIQTNTTNVMSAMQQTKSDVLRGTTLVKDAGLALEKIQNIARNLSDSIQNMAMLIHEHANKSKKINPS